MATSSATAKDLKERCDHVTPRGLFPAFGCHRPAEHSFVVKGRGTLALAGNPNHLYRLRYCDYHYARVKEGRDEQNLNVVEFDDLEKEATDA